MSFKDFCLPIICSAAMVLASSGLEAAELRYTGKFYEQGSNRQKLMFTTVSEIERRAGGDVIVNTFKDAGGLVVAVETLQLTKDGGIAAYHASQKQVGAEAEVKLEDGQAKFSLTKDGKTATDKEKATPEFAAGPHIPLDLKANWTKLMGGETLKRRLAVLDRQETIGFEFAKTKTERIDGRDVVVVRMKPSNFLISQIVAPIMFYFTPDGRLIELHGKTQLKKKTGASWSDVDAEAVFEYPTAQGS